MSTSTVSSSGFAAAGSANEWSDVVPKLVSRESAMDEKLVAEKWDAIYRLAGITGSNEKKQRAVRAGVYVYLALNGTSRVGNYSGSIILNDGTEMEAAVIPRALRGDIRRFMRGNMRESYEFFKKSRYMERIPEFVAKVATLTIAAECAFATADWFQDCAEFTPAEKDAYDKNYQHSLHRAKNARGGRSLEEVEGDHRDRELAAQGSSAPKSKSGTSIDW